MSKRSSVISICAIAATIAAALLLAKFAAGGRPGPAAAPETSSLQDGAANRAPAQGMSPELLAGSWTREDGGYTLVIGKAGPDGGLDAKYYNPRPINVSASSCSLENGDLKVFVELRDEGYPGCTYKLRYNKFDDSLVGDYHQTAMGQTFSIVFRRMKE